MKNLALTVGLAPTLVPQTTGCFSVQLRELQNQNSKSEIRKSNWWEVLVTLQFVSSDTYFMTLDLQSSSRITSPQSDE